MINFFFNEYMLRARMVTPSVFRGLKLQSLKLKPIYLCMRIAVKALFSASHAYSDLKLAVSVD